MLHRKLFRFSLLSFTLLLYPFIHPADTKRDAGAPVPGAQYVGSLPNGNGTTEIAPTANMPKGPDINPQYGGQTNSSGKNSSAGGLFGFLWNLGKKSEREIRRDDEIAKMDKILSKAASGIPLSPEEYAFTGAGKMTPQPSIPVAAPVPTPAPAPTVTAPTPTPQLSIPKNPQFAHVAGKGNPGGVTCLPQVGHEMDGSSGLYQQLPKIAEIVNNAKEPSIIDKPNFPQFNFKNPPTIGGGIPLPSNNGNGSNGDNGFVQGVGGLMAGGGAAYTLTQAAAPTAATVTTTTGGGAVVTAGSAGWGATAYGYAVAAAPYAIAATGAGAVFFGTLAVLDYVHPNEHNIFFKEKARKAIAEKAAKSQGSSSSSTTGGNGNNGKDKKGGTSVTGATEKKPRRIQPLSKTEAYAKIKDRYEHFDANKYRLRDGKEPLRTPNGKAIERLEWDHNHFGEWEAYTDLKGKNHVGALDPETLELYKPGQIGRRGSN